AGPARLPARRLPQPPGPILTSRYRHLAIRTERDTRYHLLMSGNLDTFSPRFGFPDNHTAVIAGRHQRLAVGREGKRGHGGALISLELTQQAGGVHGPGSDRRI